VVGFADIGGLRLSPKRPIFWRIGITDRGVVGFIVVVGGRDVLDAVGGLVPADGIIASAASRRSIGWTSDAAIARLLKAVGGLRSGLVG
jgi:hypothetical protein